MGKAGHVAKFALWVWTLPFNCSLAFGRGQKGALQKDKKRDKQYIHSNCSWHGHPARPAFQVFMGEGATPSKTAEM